jgi:hypothetical protein
MRLFELPFIVGMNFAQRLTFLHRIPHFFENQKPNRMVDGIALFGAPSPKGDRGFAHGSGMDL